MTTLWGLNVWANEPGGGSSAVWVSIKSNGVWYCNDSVHLQQVKGRWDGSDLVGRGGSVYFIGDQEAFWLRDFKPFEQNFGAPGHRSGDKGDGRWTNPWFTMSDSTLTWLVMAVKQGFSLSQDITDDDVEALTEDDMYSL